VTDGPEPAFVAATVQRLRAVRDANAGRLPAGWVDEAATACGVGRSTMLRYLAQGAPASRSADPPWNWGPTARAAYYRAAGNVTLARRMLEREEGAGSVASLSTMYRAAARDFAPDEQALARLGERAARGKRLVCAIENVHRNEVWLSDHKLLDVFVVLPRGKTPVRPWMTVLIDGYSRRAVGASLSITPNRGHVLSALAMAIEQCGIPEMLVFDRGREFLSHAVAEHASALGYAAVPTLAYHPHHKGKVERFHQTLNRNLAADLGVVPEPATDIRDGHLVGPRRPVSMAFMAERFFEVLRQYNQDAGHRGLAGRTPQAVYDADPTPERLIDPALLRRFALAGESRRVSEFGVRFRGRHYYAPQLEGHRGEQVEIRWAQDDPRVLDIYRDERYWCSAPMVDPASPQQRAQVIATRQEHTKRQRADLRLARRRERETWKAMAKGHTPGLLSVMRDLGIETDLDIPAGERDAG
jgi:putative transposase